MNTLKAFGEYLISADDNNPYNGHPEKKGYKTRHDIEDWGEFGKARPIWGCFPIILFIVLATYLIYTFVDVLSRPVPF